MSTYSEMWKAVDDNVPGYDPDDDDVKAILEAVLNVLREQVHALLKGAERDRQQSIVDGQASVTALCIGAASAYRTVLQLLDGDEEGAA